MANYSVWLFVVHVCWSLPGAGIVREKGESEDLASFPFQYAAGDETGIEWGYAQVAWTTTAKPEACPAPSSWLEEAGHLIGTSLEDTLPSEDEVYSCLKPLLPVLACLIIDNCWNEGSGIPIVLAALIAYTWVSVAYEIFKIFVEAQVYIFLSLYIMCIGRLVDRGRFQTLAERRGNLMAIVTGKLSKVNLLF